MRSVVYWAIPIALLVVARVTLPEPLHLHGLRIVLLLTAAGEGFAAVANMLRAPQFAERNGRPYDPAYHGMMQDFGFYNLAVAALLVASAVDPVRNLPALGAIIGLYLIHGLTHVLR